MQQHLLDTIQKGIKSMQMTTRLKRVLNFKSILNALMHWGSKDYAFIAFRNCARVQSIDIRDQLVRPFCIMYIESKDWLSTE